MYIWRAPLMGFVVCPNVVLVMLGSPFQPGVPKIGWFSTFCIVTCTRKELRPGKAMSLLSDASNDQ